MGLSLGRVLRPAARSGKHHHALRWITDDIAVSGAPSDRDWRKIMASGITAVVDLRDDGENDSQTIERLRLSCVHLPVREGCAPPPRDLDGVTRWIADRVAAGGRVLVHCREGRGRSALVACATLIRLGFTPLAAFALVRRAHPGMALSLEQSAALEDFVRSRRLEAETV